MQAIILFPGAARAQQRIAGLPAAARAGREAAQGGFSRVVIAVPTAWTPGAELRNEAERLAPNASVEFLDEAGALASAADGAVLLCGERLIETGALARAERLHASAAQPADIVRLRDGGGAAELRAAGRRIITATTKPGDGIVSRHINRPVSQAISRLLLHLAWVRPGHATWGTALLAIMMAVALLSGTQAGLIVGALLFQAASIFDGVDGEIARATFRSSPQGAKIDSLVDAATNLACVGGVALNLHFQGESGAALAGAAGMAMLGCGLALIAYRSRTSPAGFTFNAVKDHFSHNRSKLMTFLTWLTMRDFFALAGAILIIAGLAGPALFAFAIVAAGWLVVVVRVMTRQIA